MAIIVVSLLVLVPLALLTWDLARQSARRKPAGDAPAPRAVSGVANLPGHGRRS